MRADDAPGSGDSRMSPKVEQFLKPRETPSLPNAVVAAAHAGVIASLGGAAVLIYAEQTGFGSFALASKVIALRLVGNPALVESTLGVAALYLWGLACGIAGGALFGVVIAKLIGKVGAIAAVGIGLTYGLLLWSVGQFVLIATFAPDSLALTNEHAMLGAHAVYGVLLGLLSGWSKEPRPPHELTRFSLRRLWG